jgi:L-histidine Nalpha-methyltransferase
METAQHSVSVLEPADADFLSEALAGLSRSPRTLPCKFFYDERGSELFQQICELPEYYVTRTELQILEKNGTEIAEELGAGLELIGLGTGAGTKTRLLLEKLRDPVAYVPVDISKEQLEQSSILFRKLFPNLEVLPVCADYLQPVTLPIPSRSPAHRVTYFPGSTIGNFEPGEARSFLQRVQRICAPGDGLLIGVDLKKDRRILERAYNDAAGVTAEFNINLLVRANRELGADFDLAHWHHRAVFNEKESRIEMHLISDIAQTVHLGGREFPFAAGETIITEFSYKHSREAFNALAAEIGFDFRKLWTDDDQLFGVFLFQVNE